MRPELTALALCGTEPCIGWRPCASCTLERAAHHERLGGVGDLPPEDGPCRNCPLPTHHAVRPQLDVSQRRSSTSASASSRSSSHDLAACGANYAHMFSWMLGKMSHSSSRNQGPRSFCQSREKLWRPRFAVASICMLPPIAHAAKSAIARPKQWMPPHQPHGHWPIKSPNGAGGWIGGKGRGPRRVAQVYLFSANPGGTRLLLWIAHHAVVTHVSHIARTRWDYKHQTPLGGSCDQTQQQSNLGNP